MAKILIFLFSLQQTLVCFLFSIELLNKLNITQSLSYACICFAMIHYLIMGLKEILIKKD